MATIAIIGPGAMGCLFSAFLARAGHRVWLVDHRSERVAQLRSHDLIVESDSDTFQVAVEATTNAYEVPPAELVMVCVKAYATSDVVPTAAVLAQMNGSVLTLQNGLGNLDALAAQVSPTQLLGGVTAQGATLLGTGHVRHAGVGATAIGARTEGGSDRAKRIAALLTEAGISTEVTGSLDETLWHKLVINAAINPLGALLRVPNGTLVEHGESRSVMQAVTAEATTVASARGIGLSAENATALVEQVCRETAGNLNSMLQDVLRRRRTEISAINGAIIREGEQRDVPTTVNRLLVELVLALEQTYQKQMECQC